MLISGNVNWPDFTRLVLRHRLYPIVYRYFKKLAHPGVPDDVMTNLSQFDKENIYKTLKMLTEFQTLLKSFDEGGITAVPIKGFPLAYQLFGDITLRTSRDLDILISPVDVDRSMKILERKGYVCNQSLNGAFSLKRWMKFNKHLEYQNHHLGICVELHWRLNCHCMDLPQDIIRGNMQLVRMLDYSVKIFGRESLLLYLVIHGAAHGWFRLKWLLDIDTMIRKGDFCWDKLYQLANHLELRTVVNQTLILVRTFFGTPLPDDVTQSARMDTRAHCLANMALHLITDEDNQPSNTKPLIEKCQLFYRQKLYECSLLRTQNKLSFISCVFSPSVEDLELLPLPEKLYFIYYIISPLTWIYRSTFKVMLSLFQGCDSDTL
ncbi:nucleotidyltransferase domain-containing protein [Sporomusa acidovorans]|uniref:nucleotidyltransferase domain-containing protein n=1 Tax=Sporomusa acidovorans TaxID=112900 RepID=UPI0015A23F87|nr:nucleotidyltransferase family protein [Sporomusa acidovorans]